MREMLVNMGVCLSIIFILNECNIFMCTVLNLYVIRLLAGDGRSTAIVPPEAARAMQFGKLAGDGRSAAIVPPEAARAM